MSTKDEVFKPSVYDAPPENLEAARDRIQLLTDPDPSLETAREATEYPPLTMAQAKERISAAGIAPTNLIGMVWKNIEQFSLVLKEFGWEAHIYCHKDMMDAGRYKVYVGVAKADRKNKIGFFLWEKPHYLVVLVAKTLSASKSAQKTLKEVADLISQYAGDLDVI